jgi:predicted RNA-binding protein with EMAP domain
MKRLISAIIAMVLSLTLTLVGCTQKQAVSSKEAIETANTLETVNQKVDYLIQQARSFYNSKEFQEAVTVAQHILQYLDSNSQEAKNILERAKEALAAVAKGAVEDVKGKLPGFGQ